MVYFWSLKSVGFNLDYVYSIGHSCCPEYLLAFPLYFEFDSGVFEKLCPNIFGGFSPLQSGRTQYLQPHRTENETSVITLTQINALWKHYQPDRKIILVYFFAINRWYEFIFQYIFPGQQFLIRNPSLGKMISILVVQIILS